MENNTANQPATGNRCRCDDVPMGNRDHCPECGCEEFEETCECQDCGALMARVDHGTTECPTFRRLV